MVTTLLRKWPQAIGTIYVNYLLYNNNYLLLFISLQNCDVSMCHFFEILSTSKQVNISKLVKSIIARICYSCVGLRKRFVWFATRNHQNMIIQNHWNYTTENSMSSKLDVNELHCILPRCPHGTDIDPLFSHRSRFELIRLCVASSASGNACNVVRRFYTALCNFLTVPDLVTSTFPGDDCWPITERLALA